MPSVTYIRKKIQSVLATKIIPALQSQKVLPVQMGPPFDFSRIEHKVLQEEPLPSLNLDPLQVYTEWKAVGMQVNRMPMLGFVYQGVSNERMGFYPEMAKRLKLPDLPPLAGITGLRLPAPAVYYFPALVPHGDSSQPFLEIMPAAPGPFGILALDLFGKEVWVRLIQEDGEPLHLLQINDIALARLAWEYSQLLQSANESKAQRHLTRLMLRLGNLPKDVPVRLNTGCWPPIVQPDSGNVPETQLQLWHDTVDYIQLHLHGPLSLEILSHQIGVSSAHLNRIFQRITGTTLMRFITYERVEVAKQMLADQVENISDIAMLTGFANVPSFDGAFRRQTGMSPRTFRRLNREENTFASPVK